MRGGGERLVGGAGVSELFYNESKFKNKNFFFVCGWVGGWRGGLE